MRDMLIDLALINGYNVVVDDTNFEAKHLKQIKMLSEINEAEVEVKVFNTTLEECIERDKNRENGVGESVIRDMHERYLSPHKSQ